MQLIWIWSSKGLLCNALLINLLICEIEKITKRLWLWVDIYDGLEGQNGNTSKYIYEHLKRVIDPLV